MTALVSIVVPVVVHRAQLTELVRGIAAECDALTETVEIILVDDGKSDASYSASQEIVARDPRFKILRLERAFGQKLVQVSQRFGGTLAVMTGVDQARGDAIVTLSGEMQDPPELIGQLVAHWRRGYKVVHAVPTSTVKAPAKERARAAFADLVRRLAVRESPAGKSTARLIDRSVLPAFRASVAAPGEDASAVAALTVAQVYFPYARTPGRAGSTPSVPASLTSSAYAVAARLRLAPLKTATIVGVVVSTLSLAVGCYVAFAKISGWYTVEGWTSLITMISFLGGVQLLVLGILGEYVGRIYLHVQGRPMYMVEASRTISVTPRTHAGPTDVDGKAS